MPDLLGLRADNQTDSAQQRRCDVVRVPAADRRLAFQTGRQQLRPLQGFAETGIGRQGRRHRAGGAAAQAAVERQALVQPHLQACVRPRQTQDSGSSHRGRIAFRLTRQQAIITFDGKQRHARFRSQRDLNAVARPLHSHAQDIESCAQVGDGGRCECPDKRHGNWYPVAASARER